MWTVKEQQVHEIFVRKYKESKKSSEKPIGKTIILYNVPPYAATKESLLNLFNPFGRVDNVMLETEDNNEHNTRYTISSKFFRKASAFKFLRACIVFKKSSSVDAVMSAGFTLPYRKEIDFDSGVSKWITINNKKSNVDIKEMQLEIDEYMRHYDKVKEALNQQTEDDGWTLVGRNGFKQHESVVHRLEEKVEYQKKKARKNLQQISGPYGFEARETKKQELIELSKKFEEDKFKLRIMRRNRKFKPY